MRFPMIRFLTIAFIWAVAFTTLTVSGFMRNGILSKNLSPEPNFFVSKTSPRFQSRLTLRMSSLPKVMDVVAEALGVEREKVKPSSHFVNDLGADSLQTLEFVMTLEEKFNIKIEDEQAAKLSTVEEAANYIDSVSKSEVKVTET